MKQIAIALALSAGASMLAGCADRLATASGAAGDEVAGLNDVLVTNLWRGLCAMPVGAAYRRLGGERFDKLVEIVKADDGTCKVKP